MIDVIVPVYNKRPFLAQAVGSVLEAAEADGHVRVTVVDNGSTDGSIETLRGLCEGRARLLEHPGGTIGAVRNAGARTGDAPIVSFLDCDCVVPRDYFDRLRRALRDPSRAATGCRVDYPTDGPWVERVWHALHRSGITDGPRAYINSGNLAVRREVFDAVGGFDEVLVTGEDAELGQRINARGLVVWEAHELVVLHLDNPRTLRAFFRKEIWHGQGMLGTLRLWPPHLPALSTLLHFACLVAAVGTLAAAPIPVVWRLAGALGLAFTTPVLVVAYRALTKRRAVPWIAATILYQAYLLARLVAVAQIAGRALRPRAAR